MKMRILLLVLMLLLLLFSYAFRYEQQAYTPAAKRYLDRWTGVEWVKAYTWNGSKRFPLKFTREEYIENLTPEEIKQEFAQIYQLHCILTGTWLLLTVLVISLIYKSATRAKKNG